MTKSLKFLFILCAIIGQIEARSEVVTTDERVLFLETNGEIYPASQDDIDKFDQNELNIIKKFIEKEKKPILIKLNNSLDMINLEIYKKTRFTETRVDRDARLKR